MNAITTRTTLQAVKTMHETLEGSGYGIEATVAKINKVLRTADADFKLVAGNGYYYFVDRGGNLSILTLCQSTSVGVYRANQATMSFWIGEAVELLIEAIAEAIRLDAFDFKVAGRTNRVSDPFPIDN